MYCFTLIYSQREVEYQDQNRYVFNNAQQTLLRIKLNKLINADRFQVECHV